MGGKTSTTTQKVQIPKEVLARYNAVNARAEGVAQNPFQIYSTDPSDFVAQLNNQQLGGIEAVNSAAGAYRPYLDQAALTFGEGLKSAQPGDLTVDKFMNPFQQQVIDATMRQMAQANEQAQSGALGTAVSSGAFGGDRAGIAAANLANQQGLSMGSTLAGLNAQNYNQALQTAQQQQGLYLGATQADLERMMQGGQFYAGLGQAAQAMGLQGAEAMINAGTLGQQTEQAGKTAMYNQYQQEQAYPFQVAQFLANIAMGTGALSGSTTTTTQPAPFFSDRRLKEDIRRIGHTDDGLPIYKFKYKGDEGHQTHIGFMADEVEKVKPEAVGVSGGYKTVDYDRATKAGGGGVAGPYSVQAGSDSPYAAGYVPQAYLPVGELMIADPAILQNAEQGMDQQLAAAADFGDNIVRLRDTFGKKGSRDRSSAQRSAEAAANTKVEPSMEIDEPHAGVAGYAAGGSTYASGGLSAAENPVSDKTYLTDTLESQKKDDEDRATLTPGAAPGQQQSTLGQIGDAASSITAIATLASMLSDRRAKENIRRIGRTDHGMPIYSFKYKGDDREQTHIGFMADEVERDHPGAVMTGSDGYKRVDYGQAHKFYRGGGVRPAFQDGGGDTYLPGLSEEDKRRVMLAADMRAFQTRKPVIIEDANEVGISPEALAGRGAPAVTRYNSGLYPAPANPAEGGVAPPPAAMETSPRPPANPRLAAAGEALAADAVKAISGGVSPVVAAPPTGGGVAPAPEVRRDGSTPDIDAARNFYQTRIIQQESGGRQFDENGNPLTSSAGAIGIGQIMPATGPEAAKLAGLEWDEERFRTDPSYNSALGEAYFLDQYRRFGSLELAAAAYNAGPGRLSSAMDRAAALGGSYLDYLPKETQNYVRSTTGSGVAVAAPSGGEDRRGLGAGVLNPERPYEDRNWLGQMFYNPDGTVNGDAMLSILSGIGTMASSPSRYLGSAILQGIGGAANTYAGLRRQRSDIRAQDAETANIAAQLIKNSLITDPATNLSYIPLEGGGTQRFSDWLKNPAGRSMAGAEADEILRGIGADFIRRGLNVDQINPDVMFDIDETPVRGPGEGVSSPAPVSGGDISTAGLPVPTEPRPVTEIGNFPITPIEENLINTNIATMESVAPATREAILQQSQAASLGYAAEASAASGAFRNLNELAKVVAEASGDASLGPFGNLKAGIDGILQQAAATFGIEYDGSAAAQEQLLNKLSQLQANEITAGTAAAELFLRNKQMFPDISSDPKAAAEITAAAMTGNMENFERGAYARNIEARMAQEGPFVNLNGLDQAFTERTRNLYQTEKSNISALLQAASDESVPPGARLAIKEFLRAANAGEYESAEEAQAGLESIFAALPGSYQVSSGLGRYFVQ